MGLEDERVFAYGCLMPTAPHREPPYRLARWVQRTLPWVAVSAAVAGILITALSGIPERLPGIALSCGEEMGAAARHFDRDALETDGPERGIEPGPLDRPRSRDGDPTRPAANWCEGGARAVAARGVQSRYARAPARVLSRSMALVRSGGASPFPLLLLLVPSPPLSPTRRREEVVRILKLSALHDGALLAHS